MSRVNGVSQISSRSASVDPVGWISRSGSASRIGGSVSFLGRSEMAARATLRSAADTGVCVPTRDTLQVHGSGSALSATPTA